MFKGGGLGVTRTHDQRLKRPLLYRLSYQPILLENTKTRAIGRVLCLDQMSRQALFDILPFEVSFSCTALPSEGLHPLLNNPMKFLAAGASGTLNQRLLKMQP